MPIAVAVYRPEQYARLLATAEDASDLEPTCQEWHTVYQQTRRKMAELGIIEQLATSIAEKPWSLYNSNIWPVTTDLYTSAGYLCRSHRLRAYDAVQLACILALRQ
jgi:predicted nucleic acid-binding protein